MHVGKWKYRIAVMCVSKHCFHSRTLSDRLLLRLWSMTLYVPNSKQQVSSTQDCWQQSSISQSITSCCCPMYHSLSIVCLLRGAATAHAETVCLVFKKKTCYRHESHMYRMRFPPEIFFFFFFFKLKKKTILWACLKCIGSYNFFFFL